MATLAELNADLITVNTAISEMIAGGRITRFRIGSGTSIREYQFSEVTIEFLKSERDRILKEIETLSATEMQFRRSSRMQTTFSKL